MPQDLTNDKLTLIHVMAWCRQASSHCLNQCWPRSPTPYGVTRPQCVKYGDDWEVLHYTWRAAQMKFSWGCKFPDGLFKVTDDKMKGTLTINIFCQSLLNYILWDPIEDEYCLVCVKAACRICDRLKLEHITCITETTEAAMHSWVILCYIVSHWLGAHTKWSLVLW